MDNTFSFELRADKTDRKGYRPVRVVYRVEGDRERFATSIKVHKDNWDSLSQRAVYKDKETAAAEKLAFSTLMLDKDVKQVNNKLQAVEDTVDDIEKEFKKKKVKYTALMVKTEFEKTKDQNKTTKKDESPDLVAAYIEKYIDEQRTSLAKGSLTVFNNLKNHLREFTEATNKRVQFSKMDNAFFKAFQNYAIQTKGLRNTTTEKLIKKLKTVVRYAEKAGVEVNTKYKDFSIKTEKLPVIALEQSELDKLFYLDLSDKSKTVTATRPDGTEYGISYETLSKVRDVFCFMAETGVRFSDAMALKRSNIFADEIKISVIKTKDTLDIPLNPYTRLILDRYTKDIHPLPKMTNQRFNQYIKPLCKLAGIDTEIEIVRYKGADRVSDTFPKYELTSAHVARKTFITLSLERGMSAEQVKKISGHESDLAFKKYVNVTNKVAKKAMEATRGEIDFKRLMKAI